MTTLDSELLKLKIPNFIYRIAQFLEILISVIVIVAIAVSLYAVLV